MAVLAGEADFPLNRDPGRRGTTHSQELGFMT